MLLVKIISAYSDYSTLAITDRVFYPQSALPPGHPGDDIPIGFAGCVPALPFGIPCVPTPGGVSAVIQQEGNRFVHMSPQ